MKKSARIAARLLSWYDREKRDLPWRRTQSPWAIWVSEVMLQQTRVETVVPYWESFLQSFPDPASLAAAPEERALALWSGLGYYSRVRNLRRAAALVADVHQGHFPEDWERALALPGIGPYTAAAILSIAYGKPHAVVDGNVARVLARLMRLEPPLDRNPRTLQEQAGALLDPNRPGDWNQAMMELGATVCLPARPDCQRCPLRSDCRAWSDGVVDRYPSPKPRRSTVEVMGRAFLLWNRNAVLLERGGFDLLPHLWLPPISLHPADDLPPPRLEEIDTELATRSRSELRLSGRFRHAITHHRLRFEVVSGDLSFPNGGARWPAAAPRPSAFVKEISNRHPPERCWFPRARIEELGRSAILTKALRVQEAVAR